MHVHSNRLQSDHKHKSRSESKTKIAEESEEQARLMENYECEECLRTDKELREGHELVTWNPKTRDDDACAIEPIARKGDPRRLCAE